MKYVPISNQELMPMQSNLYKLELEIDVGGEIFV
jgi:hypothetical protein